MRSSLARSLVTVTITSLCLAQAPPHKTADWFFDDPGALCQVLIDYKIEPRPWASHNSLQKNAGPFFCEGIPDPRELANAPEEKSVETIFRVSGDTSARADIISVSVKVLDSTGMQTGQRDIKRYLESIFKAIDKPEPIALARSVDARREYLSTQTYGVLWFNVVRPMRNPDQPVFWFRLSKREIESRAAAN